MTGGDTCIKTRKLKKGPAYAMQIATLVVLALNTVVIAINTIVDVCLLIASRK